jgi:hypothetical protein
MALFKAYSPKVEVNGETVLSVVDGLGAFKNTAMRLLKESGIDNPTPGQWYLQQNWLDCFRMISEKLGQSTLQLIGEAIPKNAKWPPMVNSIETALGSIDIAYHMNHRNGEIGNYKFQMNGKREATVQCTDPYPDAFDLGIIASAATKFAKPGENVVVKIDETKPTRTKGAESTLYCVTW